MRIPKQPPVGHLIAYEYVWASQSAHREDGAKSYPAAIVATRDDIGPTPLTYVLGISHKPPTASERAIEIPSKLKRHLGLDEEPSWIYTDQINVFAWPGPDIRPAEWLTDLPSARGNCVIGKLPADWFNQVMRHLAESYRLKAVRVIRRT